MLYPSFARDVFLKQFLPFSKYSKHFTWSGFKRNSGKLQRLMKQIQHLDFGILIMQTSLIYYTQDFRV